MTPDSELEWMREEFDRTLGRTCTTKVKGTPTAVRGQFTEAETVVATGVKCSFMATAGNERQAGAAITKVGNYVVSFEHGAVITPTTTAYVDALGSQAAKVFQMVAPLDTPDPIGQRWLATEG